MYYVYCIIILLTSLIQDTSDSFLKKKKPEKPFQTMISHLSGKIFPPKNFSDGDGVEFKNMIFGKPEFGKK